MEAPDIIYINGFSAFATVPVKEGIEYIRKEALLEWARIEKNKCVGNSSWQRFNALQDMIDKLNSL